MNRSIEQHYSREFLYENIIAMLERAGITKEEITRKDLAAVDEFHVRGLEATKELAAMARLIPGQQVLDIGCGIGGPARLLAGEYDCQVTGVDITREYIRTATLLSGLLGLQDRTRFIHADALTLPFPDQQFDVVWTQHVQMNIENKKKFYSEIARVLKKGGRFVYYDIFCVRRKQILFPVPWADQSSNSFLVTAAEAAKILQQCGLIVEQQTDQREQAIQSLELLINKLSAAEKPPVSLQLIIGALFYQKLQQLQTNFMEGRLEISSGTCIKATI